MARYSRKTVEACARIVETVVNDVSRQSFVVNGQTLKTKDGADEFLTIQDVNKLLRDKAAAIRALVAVTTSERTAEK